MSDYRAQTLDELSRRADRAATRSALIGFDGFVDRILRAVDKRQGPGDAYTPMRQITDFGNRINAAAGESANIELHQVREKLGGNGPIMANAVAATGMSVRYVGALGQPLHPVFSQLAARAEITSICDPATTDAVEFEDGKIMLGKMASLDQITYRRLIEVMGEGRLFDALARANLIGLVNWTMVPHMTSVLADLINHALPNLPPSENGRAFFFDLADPAKRADADILAVLRTISRFRSFGAAILGLNLAESRQIARVLGIPPGGTDPEGLRSTATSIRQALDLTCVVIHPRDGAACATREDAWHVKGPFCERPLISTGAGDHFNAGFAVGHCLGLTPPACLTLAVATSGQYVRTAESPTLRDSLAFLQSWTS